MARRCFPACFYVFTACLVAAESPTYGLKGQEVKLNPLISGLPNQILWLHNGDKVVEFNGNEQHVYETYENRINLDWDSAQLHITDLRFKDSGVYELEVLTDKNFYRQKFYLLVIDKTNVAEDAGLTSIYIVVIVVAILIFFGILVSNGILLYVYRHEVCSCLNPAKGKSDDLENQSTPTQGSQKEESQGDEDEPLLELQEAGNNKKSGVADVSLSHNSPNMASGDSAGESKEDVSSV